MFAIIYSNRLSVFTLVRFEYAVSMDDDDVIMWTTYVYMKKESSGVAMVWSLTLFSFVVAIDFVAYTIDVDDDNDDDDGAWCRLRPSTTLELCFVFICPLCIYCI